MNYSQFLFHSLLLVHNNIYSKLTYDTMFDNLFEIYDLYELSSYNDDKKSEYNCIEEFITHSTELINSLINE